MLKFLNNSFFMEHLQWLLLKFYNYFCFFALLCFKKKKPKAAVADVPFLQNTSVRLLQKFVEYLFLEYFFVSLDKSILLHRRCLMSKFSGILVMVCRKIFSAFSNETFSKLFPPYARVSLFSHHLAFYDRKHFYSILTDSKSSLCWVMI